MAKLRGNICTEKHRQECKELFKKVYCCDYEFLFEQIRGARLSMAKGLFVVADKILNSLQLEFEEKITG